MELVHSRGHFLKGGSVHRHRQGGSSTANPPSKLDWSSKQHQQHRHSPQNAAQHFLSQSQVKVGHGERGVLPQSSSMEPQTTAGPKQPQAIKVQARAYSQHPSASSSPSRPPNFHAAAVGGGSFGGSEGWGYSQNFGRKRKQQHQQSHHSGTGASGGGGGEGSGRGGRIRPRPSSARDPTSRSSMVGRNAAGNAGARTEEDAVQASFFPLLSADDDVEPTPAAIALTAAGVSPPPATSASTTAGAPMSSRSVSLKPHQHRERGVGQPLRAHPIPTSANGVSQRRNADSDGPAVVPAAGAGGERGASCGGGKGGGGHQAFTPRSLAAATQASAKPIVSRVAVPQASPPNPAHGVNNPSRSGSAGGVAGMGRGHGRGKHEMLQQLSHSENTSTDTSPRISRINSAAGIANYGGAPPHGGGGSSSGAFAPRHGGQTATNVATGGGSGSGSGRGCVGGTSSNSRNVRVFPKDGAGGDRNGRESDQAVMRLPEGNDNSNVSCGTPAVGGDDNCRGSGMSLQQQLDAASTSATLNKAANQLLEGSVDNAGMLEVGDENGVLLPGPEGGVEVREFQGGVLLVRRSEDAKKRSPERLNLHRRRLTSCPIIQGDNRLRLLNYQNNLISKITNLANLPNLIFIDLYNNVIDTLEGPLSTMAALRVMMVGKNKIQKISNLHSLRKLDVLDLHSNSIQKMGGLDGLQDLRVLNLAGNQIKIVENVSCLTALTELNLRRNNVEKVMELDNLPRLQRLFLSNNRINSFEDCSCVFSVGSLMELSLYGNPVAGQNGLGSSYRSYILQHLPKLHHLDLKRVTDHGHSISHQDSDGNIAPPATRTASADGVREGRGGGNNGRSRNEFHEVMGTSGKDSRKPSGISRTGGNGVSSSGTNSKEVGNDGFPVLTLSHGSADTQSRGEHHPGSSSPGLQQQQQHQHQHSRGNDDPRGIHRTGLVMSAPAPDRGAIDSEGRVHGGAWEQVTVFTTTAGDCGITSGDHSRPAARKEVVLAVGTGMSRAAEAREAVALKRAKTDREEREKTALKERREAIEAARRACWERRGGGSITTRARHRSPRDSTSAGRDNTIKKTTAHVKPPPASLSSCSAPTGPDPADNSNTGGGAVPPRPEPPPPSPRSPTPPSRRTSPSANTGSEVEGTAKTGGGVGGRRSRDAGRRGSISGGVGYFELEQRLRHNRMGVGDVAVATSGGGVPGGASGITLKVYGDVWRWLGDGKVCSLREQVVEARFSLVHVTSVARKASIISQTFPNLSCLQLLDNDIRSLRQLERLRPMLTNLTALHLGKNPVTRNASEAALRAWVKGQGPRVRLVSQGHRSAGNGRNVCTGDRRRHTQQQHCPLTNSSASQQQSPPSTTTTQAPPSLPAAPTPHPPCGISTHSAKPFGGEVGVSSRNSNGYEKGGEKATTRFLEQGEAGDTAFAATQDQQVQSTEDNNPGSGGIMEQPTRSASEGPSDPAGRSGHTAANELNSTASSAALARVDYAGRDPLASTDTAFERLAEARSRAASSSWGAIALAGSNTASHVGDDPDGVNGMAWASSARGAKLACNGMVRRVCEAHRKDESFDQDWEGAVQSIIEEVLTPGRKFSHGHTGISPRQKPPRPKGTRGTVRGGDWARVSKTAVAHSEATMTQDAQLLHGDFGTQESTSCRNSDRNPVRTHTPRACWLDDW
ncbi:unnamed protein product [Ectocarpus fasciculatus]